jgi:hypothetical protein
LPVFGFVEEGLIAAVLVLGGVLDEYLVKKKRGVEGRSYGHDCYGAQDSIFGAGGEGED